MKKSLFTLAAIATLAVSATAHAATEYHIIIKDHKFYPEVLTVKAGEKFKLRIDNQDPTPEEFESYDLHREKIIRGNGKATIFLPALDVGEYKYFGEFNEATAQGKIIVE